MSTEVLFMCPHAAGKSIIAATYFQEAAQRRGLDVLVRIAGTDPDDEVMPNVREALEREGLVVDAHPSAVSEGHAAAADVIISIGCDHAEIPTNKPITEWDVPMLSDDLPGSMAAIRSRVDDLIKVLAATY